jgi:tRNA (mo5U34)-methyltransferase
MLLRPSGTRILPRVPFLVEKAFLQRDSMAYDSAEKIQERIKGIKWAHPINLGHGVAQGEWHIRRRFERRLKLMQIPENLKGWTVLDIGAWDGYFSFECERRGADRVLAIDTYAWDTPHGMDGFLAAKEILGSKVDYKRMDVQHISPAEIGKFDLVLFFGVLYHLRNPIIGLEKIAGVTNKLLICETHVLLPFIHERHALIPFFPGDEETRGVPYDLCAIPTLKCLTDMLRAAGFKELDVKYKPSFRYWKKFVALLKNMPQTGRGIVHARV